MKGWTPPCERCKKKVEFWLKECDTSGLAWHMGCFICSICDTPLNEKSVNLRGEKKNQLFCEMHKTTLPGSQPLCKVFFSPYGYRVVF